jgi:predicted P-loop ATPase
MLIALREAPELGGLFGFDEMKQRTVFLRPVEGGEAFETPCEVTDREVLQILEWAQTHGILHMTKGVVQDAIDHVSRERSFHPVRAWLSNLSWDGRERLKDLFPVYLGAERSTYTEAIGRMFLIAMVARIMRPGCKADYMPILEGEQGAEKSKVGKVLAGPWFSDHLPDIRNDQASAQHLAGKWLIEVAEMDSFSKAEATRYKAFVTRETDRYRPPYARNEIEQPRQCVFFGTTNEDEYLRDTTGGRRFWPVRVGKISISDLERDREQLFAEAVKRFQDREIWWPAPDFEAEYFRPEQERRSLPDPWTNQVQEIISNQDRVFVGETLTALGFLTKDQGTATYRRVSTILKKLGWELGSPSRGKIPYVRTDRAAPKQEPPI